MPAKPILDIAVLLREFEDGERCIEPMENIGYVHKGVDEVDIPGDRFFLRGHPPQEGCSDGRSDQDSHPPHVHARQSQSGRDHFLFRDYLIAHPEVAAEYARLKLALAGKHSDDRTSYSTGKRSFIRAVIAKAAEESE